MRNFIVIIAVIGFSLVAFMSCQDKGNGIDNELDIPSFTVALQGYTIEDGAIHLPVTQATTISLDYTVTTTSRIQRFVYAVNDVEELVAEANGKDKFTGILTLDVPYESKVIKLKFNVKDERGREASKELSVEVTAHAASGFSGESDGILWEVDELSDGSMLTLSDTQSRFGIKTNPLPMYFFDFSAGSAAPHPTYSRKDGTKIKQTVGTVSTEQIPPNKTQSWKAPLKDLVYGSSVVKIKDTDFAPGVSIFVRRYWTHDGNKEGLDQLGRFNHKLCRLWPSGGGINPYYQYDRLLMEGAPSNFAKYWNGATFHTPFVRIWVLDEVRYVASSALNAEDASIHLRRNGVFVSELVNSVSRTSEKPGQWDELSIDQVHNLSEVPEGFAVYYDMLAVDDSEQRVMLTNNADLSLATEKEYLPATVWVDNEIQVYLRQGTFTSIQGKYVCIQGADGNQIGIGIQLQ